MAPVEGVTPLTSENPDTNSCGFKLYHDNMTESTGYLCRSWPSNVDLDNKVTWLSPVLSGRKKPAVSRSSSCGELVANGNQKCCARRSRRSGVVERPVATGNHLAIESFGSAAVHSRPTSLTLNVHRGFSLLPLSSYSPVSTSSHLSSDSAMDMNTQFSEDEHSDVTSPPHDVMRADFAASDADQSRDLEYSGPPLNTSDYSWSDSASRKTSSSSGDRLETLSPPAVVISDHSFDCPWSPEMNSDYESGDIDTLSLSYDLNSSSTIELPFQRRASLTSSYGSGSSMKSLLSDSSLSVDDDGDLCDLIN
ncbi:hypothetical protein NP493_359g08041 [Ridgeia piscesae]|uniref:Uncharacterized protein n=1 Tax=Ridgeia piscesae TaxID=27915 RepID=A0AAD9NTY2_RIDPI|nr:hypothetical protein NP493_359g08041 [Ridgeia piscesae]